MKSVLKNKHGFTLIEIIISIAIFVIILTLVTVNYRQGENSNIFRLQAFDIEDSIRSVQNMALTGKEINNEIPSAYGIFLNRFNGEIIIYGDNDSSKFFNLGDSEFSRNSLNDNISFDMHKLVCDEVDNFTPILNIIFIPPEPIMIINYPLDCESADISLISDNIEGTWHVHFDNISGRTWTEFNN